MGRIPKDKKTSGAVLTLGRVGIFLGITLLLLLLVLLGVVYVMEKGPSPTMTATFCRSMRETSALKWIPDIFLSDEEIDLLKSKSTETAETEAVNPSLIHITAGTEAGDTAGTDGGLQLIEISQGTLKGKLLIVDDPSRVILGTSDNMGHQAGMQLTALVEKYGAVAGINAGGFNDENGRGNGGIPQGLVMVDGEQIWGRQDAIFNLVGLDYTGVLQVGTMTVAEAKERNIRYAVSFVTYDGLASALIINGEVQTQNIASGVNPRTAIGQREDGAMLLLVLDGRSINTLGATMEDVCDVMLQYGAVNAGNLDGGSSTVMVYDGEIINSCASVTGPRNIPTAFLVLPEGETNG